MNPDQLISKEAVVSYVPTEALEQVRRHGLLGGKALLSNPEALVAAAKARKEDPEKFRKDTEDILAGWKKYQALGPNVLFQAPPPSTALTPNHPFKRWDLTPLEVNLRQLLKDQPKTRVYGMELEPYDEKKHYTGRERHHYLNKRKTLKELLSRRVEDLWKDYGDPEGKGYYAANVPHASIHTPDGVVPAKYLTFPEKRGSVLYHGSSTPGLKHLEPKPTSVLQGQPAVFATPDRDLALTFGAPWRDSDFEQGSVDGQRYMREQYPGAFEKIYQGRKGHVYSVPAEGFKKDRRLMRSERINPGQVTTVKEEAIEDLLEALRKTKFRLMRHDEKAEWEKESSDQLISTDHGLVSADPNNMQILEVTPTKNHLKYLFHGSDKQLTTLDLKFNSKKSFGYEYGKPVIYASDQPSSAFTVTPTEDYQKQKETTDYAYHRLTHGDRKILLGHNLNGHVHVLPTDNFWRVRRKDYENGKWSESVEYVADKPVKPVQIVPIQSPIDSEAVPEYEFLGADRVGEMPAEEYLRDAKNPAVRKALETLLAAKPVYGVPAGLQPYLSKQSSDQLISGIPDKKDYGDLSKLPTNQLIDWIVQHHQARRAGPHSDIRFGSPETGLFSWAARKGLPEPGKKHLAVRQPVHDHSYGEFQGTIDKGYGAGTVTQADKGKVLITKVEPNKVHFVVAHKKFPERYVLVRPETFGDKDWLLMNTTPRDPVKHEKIHYKSIPKEQVEPLLKDLQPGASVQAKLDGALTLSSLLKDHIEVLSHRTSTTGKPIPRTEYVFGGNPEVTVPKQYQNSVLSGELYGRKGDVSIPPQELGGLLNSSLAKSLEDQKERGIKLHVMPFDVRQLGRKQISNEKVPYAERSQMIRDMLKSLSGPGADIVRERFHPPVEAKTPEEALTLYRNIVAGKHPQTTEGIVVHPSLGTPQKAKLFQEHDVVLRGGFPGKGRLQDKGIGGFVYSYPDDPDGLIRGEVGTGMSDEMRTDAFNNPDAYKGRIARIRATKKLPSGSLFQPSLISLHEG